MPKELKKRGRRGEKKRKRDDHDHELSPKRQRVVADEGEHMEDTDIVVHGDAGDDFISFAPEVQDHAPVDEAQNQFYGLLEPEEQEYYANVNNKITANDFESDEDRSLFIQAVHRETQGKEMKVASSQSCSRILEKVIQLSTAEELKSLFLAFLDNLNYLVQHRFGSHCCESLFIQAAKFVTGTTKPKQDLKQDEDKDTLEVLYLRAVEELQPNIGFLVTERFASHVVRVLMLVLSGDSLHDDSTKSMFASRRKEGVDVNVNKTEPAEKRRVPQSFLKALRQMTQTLLDSIDTTYLRALATHPTGNPVIQLLLKLELSPSSKSNHNDGKSLVSSLLPDEELLADSESGKFISGLIYDPTGSHLIETLVQELPGKTFKKLYKNILKERMSNLAKNDIASYVAIRVLERLGKDDLAEAIDTILEEIPALVKRHRTGIIKVLFERCGVREVKSQRLTEAVKNAYGGDTVTLLPKMLQFYASIDDLAHHAASNNGETTVASPYKADIHGSLLAQSMLQVPVACHAIQQSLLEQPTTILVSMSKNPIASRVIQIALKSPQSQQQFRRQFVPKFHAHMAELASNPAGSHVADALWHGTSGLQFLKEKLAKELQENESTLRNSNHGRTVWRNWSMDAYLRHFREWQSLAKGGDQEQTKESVIEVKKSAIELARERHAAKRNKHANGDSK